MHSHHRHVAVTLDNFREFYDIIGQLDQVILVTDRGPARDELTRRRRTSRDAPSG
jgi:hypothetical protein